MSLQVQSDYDQLRQTFAVVSQERDVAQQQRSQLQAKVDKLEQTLKVWYHIKTLNTNITVVLQCIHSALF